MATVLSLPFTRAPSGRRTRGRAGCGATNARPWPASGTAGPAALGLGVGVRGDGHGCQGRAPTPSRVGPVLRVPRPLEGGCSSGIGGPSGAEPRGGTKGLRPASRGRAAEAHWGAGTTPWFWPDELGTALRQASERAARLSHAHRRWSSSRRSAATPRPCRGAGRGERTCGGWCRLQVTYIYVK